MESKKCRKCNTIKHVSFFSKSGLDSHGNQYYRPDCKECRKPVVNECIEANKDKRNAKNRKRMGLQMVTTVLGRFATYKAGVLLGLSFQIA